MAVPVSLLAWRVWMAVREPVVAEEARDKVEERASATEVLHW